MFLAAAPPKSSLGLVFSLSAFQARPTMSFLSLYVRVLRLLGPEKWLAGVLALANVALACSQFAEPLLLGKVIDQLSAARCAGSALLWADVGPWLLAWAGFGLFTIAAGVTVALHADRLAHRRRVVMMAAYFEHVLHLPMSFHVRAHTGRLLKVMLEGSTGLFGVWLAFFREHFAALVALVVLLPATLVVNWRLGSILVVLAIIIGIVMNVVRQRGDSLQNEAERGGSGQRRFGGAGGGRPRQRACDPELFACGRGDQRAEEAHRPHAQRPVAGSDVVGGVLGGDPIELDHRALRNSGYRRLARHARADERRPDCRLHEPGDDAGWTLEQTVTFANYMVSQSAKLRLFFEVMDTSAEVSDAADAVDVGRVTGWVQFENVSFRYDGGREALRSVSFDAPAGATIALVGATGSGKSTTLNLLHRVFDPSSGRVLIDGIDIRKIKLASLRANIGVAFQELFIFARSIEENLRIGKPDATVAEMKFALEQAQALDFVRRTPNGLRTIIGERGRNLSGGERQRLSIARALLKDPPIMVLDEATSALDAKTEGQVQKAMDAAMRGRTTFVIAHRLTTIRNADHILVFDEGRIVENGSFEELVAQGGVFAGLAKAQFMAGAYEVHA